LELLEAVGLQLALGILLVLVISEGPSRGSAGTKPLFRREMKAGVRGLAPAAPSFLLKIFTPPAPKGR